MMDDLCQFSLIFPRWLGPSLAIAGTLLTVAAIVLRLKFLTTAPNDAVNVEIGPVKFGIGWLTGLILVAVAFILAGLVSVAAVEYQPFGRWVGSKVESLVDRKDAAVSGEFTDESLSAIETNLGYSGLYVVQLSSAAKQEKLSGSFEGRCYAELINSICRQQSQRFECKTEPATRTIKVCKRGGDPECTH
jgi:hypothetical protein